MVHFATYQEHKGRILSGSPPSVAFDGTPLGQLHPHVRRLCVACDSNIGLPASQDTYCISTDPRAVSCPGCQKTSEFLKEWKVQTKQVFVPKPESPTPAPQS